jgi:hypothetical protein
VFLIVSPLLPTMQLLTLSLGAFALAFVSASIEPKIIRRQDVTTGCTTPAIRQEWRDLDAKTQQVGWRKEVATEFHFN